MIENKQHFTFEEILNAYITCKKHKRFKTPVIEFTFNEISNLYTLLEEINTNIYTVSSSSVFTVTYPKPREIWAASFRDRIVHHLIYNEIAPYYEKTFIVDSCACMKNRGTLYASDRLEKHHRSITNNYSKNTFFLQFDIANFFVSIHKPTLLSIIQRKVPTTSLTYRLIEKVILNDPTIDPVVRALSNAKPVPAHKSLWNTPKDSGIPIGNLTSQFFSNLYLNELDQYIKHVCKIKHYVRYVDDGVIFHEDKQYLNAVLHNIDNYLQASLQCKLAHHKSFIKPAHAGINFVGHVHHPFRRYIRNRTIAEFQKRTNKHFIDINTSTINSYLGLMSHSHSFNIRKTFTRKLLIPYIFTTNTKHTKIC